MSLGRHVLGVVGCYLMLNEMLEKQLCSLFSLEVIFFVPIEIQVPAMIEWCIRGLCVVDGIYYQGKTFGKDDNLYKMYEQKIDTCPAYELYSKRMAIKDR